jgi:hypothetical protein
MNQELWQRRIAARILKSPQTPIGLPTPGLLRVPNQMLLQRATAKRYQMEVAGQISSFLAPEPSAPVQFV